MELARGLELGVTGYSEPLECRHCGNAGPTRIAGRVSDLDVHVDDSGYPWASGTMYEVLVCAKCERATFRAGFWHEGMESDEWGARILYPSEPEWPAGLPDAVQREYEAARRVAPLAPNAYAVLLGRVLDAVSADRGAEGDTLYERLNDLADKQEIPRHLAEMAHNSGSSGMSERTETWDRSPKRRARSLKRCRTPFLSTSMKRRDW